MCLMSFGDNKIIIFNSAQLCHDEMVIWSLNNVLAAVGVGAFFFLKQLEMVQGKKANSIFGRT